MSFVTTRPSLTSGAPNPKSNFEWLGAFRSAMFLSLLLASTFVFLSGIATPSTSHLAIGAILLGYFPTTNLLCAKWWTTSSIAPAFILIADCLLLTVFFQITGGANNPFTILYLAQISLSLVVLGLRASLPILILSQLGYLSLFFSSEMKHRMQHQAMSSVGGHLEGMFIAFIMTTSLIVFFVNRALREISQFESEQIRLRELEKESTYLQSLTALTSQSVHELSSPLSKIAIATDELRFSLRDASVSASVKEDLNLIEDSISYSKKLLNQMVVNGSSLGRIEFTRLSVGTFAEGLRYEAMKFPTQNIEVLLDDPELLIEIPKDALTRGIASLIKNSVEAHAQNITITVHTSAKEVSVTIHDDGDGISEALKEKLGRPFLSTKLLGEGMGLGIFSIKLLCQSLHGKFSIDSSNGAGTTLSIALPRKDERMERAA